MAASVTLTSRKTAVALLGASAFPHFPASNRLDNASFARSARAFRALVENADCLSCQSVAVLDLFDNESPPADQVRMLNGFLKENANATDVIIYYCGHGAFLADRTYFLMLRATEPDHEAFTGLPWRSTRQTIEAALAMKRSYIVLDCCFAGRAVAEFQTGSIGALIDDQTFDALPRRGTALIAASARGDVALAPGDQPLTMFTGALVETLRRGIPAAGKLLSFRDVIADMRRTLPEKAGPHAVLPEIHDPVQPDGDVSAVPFFNNLGFIAPKEPEETRAEREKFELASAELDRPLWQSRIAALQALEELLAQTKSSSLTREIMERVGLFESDDSRAVSAKATAVLARFRAPSEPLPQTGPDEEELYRRSMTDLINLPGDQTKENGQKSNKEPQAQIDAEAETSQPKAKQGFTNGTLSEAILGVIASAGALVALLFYSQRLTSWQTFGAFVLFCGGIKSVINYAEKLRKK